MSSNPGYGTIDYLWMSDSDFVKLQSFLSNPDYEDYYPLINGLISDFSLHTDIPQYASDHFAVKDALDFDEIAFLNEEGIIVDYRPFKWSHQPASPVLP